MREREGDCERERERERERETHTHTHTHAHAHTHLESDVDLGARVQLEENDTLDRLLDHRRHLQQRRVCPPAGEGHVRALSVCTARHLLGHVRELVTYRLAERQLVGVSLNPYE